MLNKLINRNFITLYSFVRKTNDHEDETLTVCSFLVFWYSMIAIYFTTAIYSFVDIQLSKSNTMLPFIIYFLLFSIYIYKYLFKEDRFKVLITEHELLSASQKMSNKVFSIAFTFIIVGVSIPLALYVW